MDLQIRVLDGKRVRQGRSRKTQGPVELRSDDLVPPRRGEMIRWALAEPHQELDYALHIMISKPIENYRQFIT